MQVQIWDTAGQERFRALSQAFYRGADACCLTYDVNSPESRDEIEFWKRDFLQHCNPSDADSFPFLFLGNKADYEDSTRRAIKGGMHFFVSAKNGANVEQAFEAIVKEAVKRQRDEIIDPIAPGLIIRGDFKAPTTSNKTCCN